MWDLGAWVGGLPDVVAALNASQAVIGFYEIQAAIPAGLCKEPSALKDLATASLERPLTPVERRRARRAIFDEELFARAETVRRDLKIDYLVAITPDSIAGLVVPPDEDAETVYYDFFNSSEGRNSVVSSDGLRPLADKAQRPFEMAVGYMVVRAALVNLNEPLAFHDDTGCMFDFTDDRGAIVPGLRAPAIEPTCLEKIRRKYKDAAIAMIGALATYLPPKRAAAVR